MKRGMSQSPGQRMLQGTTEISPDQLGTGQIPNLILCSKCLAMAHRNILHKKNRVLFKEEKEVGDRECRMQVRKSRSLHRTGLGGWGGCPVPGCQGPRARCGLCPSGTRTPGQPMSGCLSTPLPHWWYKQDYTSRMCRWEVNPKAPCKEG